MHIKIRNVIKYLKYLFRPYIEINFLKELKLNRKLFSFFSEALILFNAGSILLVNIVEVNVFQYYKEKNFGKVFKLKKYIYLQNTKFLIIITLKIMKLCLNYDRFSFLVERCPNHTFCPLVALLAAVPFRINQYYSIIIFLCVCLVPL